jgi:hypothetical protein
VENDFNTYYGLSNANTSLLMYIIESQYQVMFNIHSRYSTILPTKMVSNISEYCDFCNLSLSLSKKIKGLLIYYIVFSINF